MKIIQLLAISCIAILLTGCRATSYLPAKANTEDADIQAYLKKKDLHKKATKTDSGIYYIIEEEGEEEASATKGIMMHYSARLLNDEVFDASADDYPINFRPERFIKGYEEAVGLMKSGAKGKFIIPSALAYGDKSPDGIPPNSPLVYDIEWLTAEEVAQEKAKAKEKAEAEARAKVEKEDADMQAYLKEQGLYDKAQKTDSGIYYIMEKEGEGEHPTPSETITAHYHGMLLDGTVFDSSVERGQPFKFELGRVIKGWQEAMTMMKPGGKGKFVIPSALAYGERGAGKVIPPNTPLVFDIELFSPEQAARLEAEAEEKAKAQALLQAEKDDALIKAHLTKLGISNTAKRSDSGIYYIMEKEGAGISPSISDKVKVHYHGTLLDGTVFDSSVERGEPIEFGLGQVVKGWQEAIPLLKPGGKATFYIPSGLCYGPNPRPGGKIKPNDVLVFEVELFEVK